MAYAPAALGWLADQWEQAIGSAVLSGIVGDSAHNYGYHRSANELPASDYSRQIVGDRDSDGIDRDAADAVDISMSTADMRLVTGRIYASWRSTDDPRLDTWREIIGTLDGRNVIYMDCQDGSQGTSDDSHLWHVHSGGLRINANNYDAMRAMLSVVRGETVAEWRGGEDDMAGEGPEILKRLTEMQEMYLYGQGSRNSHAYWVRTVIAETLLPQILAAMKALQETANKILATQVSDDDMAKIRADQDKQLVAFEAKVKADLETMTAEVEAAAREGGAAGAHDAAGHAVSDALHVAADAAVPPAS